MNRILVIVIAVIITLSVTMAAKAQTPYVYGYWNDYPAYPAVYPYVPNYSVGNRPYTPYGPWGVFAPAQAFGFGPYYRW